VEQKIVMLRYHKRRDISDGLRSNTQRQSARRQNRAKVGRLADLAGRLVLSRFMNVGSNLGEEDNKQDS
jgi:hypothetical protein